MITYTVKKAKRGQEHSIVKVGHSHEFKMSDITNDIAKLERFEREIKAQMDLEKAKIDNVERNHPVVKKFKDVEVIAFHIYAQAKGMHGNCESKLKEVRAQLKEYKSELVEITKQTGFKA